MDLWICRSFNHRNLRIFESWKLEIATQKLTKLRNNSQHSLSLNENILHLIIITFPLFITVHYYHRLHTIIFPFLSFITPNLLEDRPPPIVLYFMERWEIGWEPSFSCVGLAWLNNDREKDRTFRLKEYRHAKFALLSPLSRLFFSLYLFSLACFYIITSIK